MSAISHRFFLSSDTFWKPEKSEPREWRLEKDLAYTTEWGTLYIRRGTTTDLASIPKLFRSFFDPAGPYAVPAIFHDTLYRGHIINPRTGEEFTKTEADLVFLEIMEHVGVDRDDRLVIYDMVKNHGGSAWKDKYDQYKRHR